MDSITYWLDCAGRYPLLPTEELLRLAKKRDNYEEGSPGYVRIINKICLHNLRLIPTIVKGYMRSRGLRYGKDETSLDLLQLGYIGLRRAAEKYDASRGYAFSTYAAPWIRQSVYRGKPFMDNTVYIPENILVEIQYVKKHGKRSASKTGTLKDSTMNMARYAQGVGSIDIRVSDLGANGKGESTFAELLSDEHKVLGEDDRYSDRRGELRDLLSKAGVQPKVADMVMEYLRVGRLTTAARRAGIPEKEARGIYNKALEKLGKIDY